MQPFIRLFILVVSATTLGSKMTFSEEPPKPLQVEIPSFQWTSSHPVKHWLETFLQNGKVPIYESKANDNLFVPNNDQKKLIQGSLPVFVISKDTMMAKPEIKLALKKWLSTGAAQGAVEFSIVPTPAPGEKESSPLLKKNLLYLSHLMVGKIPPRYFKHWSFNPLAKHEDLKMAIDNTIPWLELGVGQKNQDPLLNETCQYVSKWLKTIQILSGKEPNLNHKAYFECHFKLKKAENASELKENIFSEIKITRLSLPLFDKDKYRFEIETELDTQSVTALAKLRKKETEP